MRIAVFGKSFSAEAKPFIENLHRLLLEVNAEISLYAQLNQFIKSHCNFEQSLKAFSSHQELVTFKPDFLITVGGDGTILDATTLVRDSGIPILGINTGRLGFLANVSRDEIAKAIKAIAHGNYSINERSVLKLDSEEEERGLNFALNEVTVSRKDTTAMVTVKVWINNQFLNSYWADGVIIATPTGSTGYSLSCNGPIIMPGAESLVITPIAPHNLNVRPFVIPNKYNIKLQVESREKQFLVSLDSRIYAKENGTVVSLSMANFTIKLVQTDIQNFPQTLRNKLMWGLDKRN
jgi:NAD+ kinase